MSRRALPRRRDLGRVTPEARREARRLAEEYKHQVFREAEAHGAVTPESLRQADQRIRRKMKRRVKLFADESTWNAVAGLGGIGLAVDSVFAAVHPFAVGSLVGISSLGAVAASGFIGGWIARKFGKSSRARKDG